MRKYIPIYEEAVSHIWLCICSILNFPIYEENLIFFFISAVADASSWAAQDRGKRCGPSIKYKITPCWVILLQPANRTAVLGQPSSLRPHCLKDWSKKDPNVPKSRRAWICFKKGHYVTGTYQSGEVLASVSMQSRKYNRAVRRDGVSSK